MRFLTGFAALWIAGSGVAFASASTGSAEVPSVPVHMATFGHGAASTGWIDFNFADDKSIVVPAKVNGQDVLVQLIDGSTTSYIDKDFAASIGFQPTTATKTSGSVAVQVQLGDLVLRRVRTSVADLHAKRTDPLSVPFILGDDLFDQAVVDLDFVHHKVNFLDPGHAIAPPRGAVAIPLTKRLDSRTVPVSIEGAAPVPFEWFLGDPAPITVYEPYYEAHQLLHGRRTSIRLGGGLNGQRPQEPVATLRRAEFAGVTFFDVPGVFPSNAVRGSDSALVSGNIGLALLSRFRLIIDYPHDRLYVLPNADASSTPFAKDRLGLYLSKQGAHIVVDFVAPGSPAQAAGFKAGEQLTLINQKPSREWTPSELADLRFTAKDTVITFTMESGSSRQVKTADYF